MDQHSLSCKHLPRSKKNVSCNVTSFNYKKSMQYIASSSSILNWNNSEFSNNDASFVVNFQRELVTHNLSSKRSYNILAKKIHISKNRKNQKFPDVQNKNFPIFYSFFILSSFFHLVFHPIIIFLSKPSQTKIAGCMCWRLPFIVSAVFLSIVYATQRTS